MPSHDDLRRAAAAIGTLPVSLHRLLAITAAPVFEFSEIVDVLDHDMSLAASVLRRANSAISAPTDRIHTVQQAVVRLGAVETLATAMNSVVGGVLQRELGRYRLSPGELWRHSCAASLAATQIRAVAAVPLPTSITTAALLHDIGKVVLDSVPVLGAVPDLSVSGDELRDNERAIFGIDHAGAGGVVAEMWHLPPAIAEGIAGHHLLVDDALPSAICLADHVAHLVVAARGADTEAETDETHSESDPGHAAAVTSGPAASAGLILGIDQALISQLVDSTGSRLADLLERFDAVSVS